MSAAHCPDCEVQWEGRFTACFLCGGPASIGVFRTAERKTYPWSTTVIIPVRWDAEDLDELVNL